MSIFCWNLAIRRTQAFIGTGRRTTARACVSSTRFINRQREASRSPHCRQKSLRLFSSLVSQVAKESIDWLDGRNVPEPEASVHQLLAHALNLSWSDGFYQIRTNDPTIENRIVTPEEQASFQALLNRRATLEPLQYILGQWDFLDYTLQIQSPLLCPRPETEELVLHVEKDARDRMEKSATFRILDIGCGTGAIGIALADRLPRSKVTAIDVEPTAVKVSNMNAAKIIGDRDRYEAILCNVADFNLLDGKKFDLIVSNPPYIPRADMATLSEDVSNYESHTALCGGNDGLDVVRTIIEKMSLWMESGSSCWMEVDPTHPAMLEQILCDDPKVGFESTLQDMFGRDRFVKLIVR